MFLFISKNCFSLITNLLDFYGDSIRFAGILASTCIGSLFYCSDFSWSCWNVSHLSCLCCCYAHLTQKYMLVFLPNFCIFDQKYLIVSTQTRVIEAYNVAYATFATRACIKIIKQNTIEILKIYKFVMISKFTFKGNVRNLITI